MSTIEKLLLKAKQTPNGVRFDEIKKLLSYYGYDHIRTTGSHAQFRNSNGNVITVKIENPVKAVYVKDVLSRIGEKNEKNS